MKTILFALVALLIVVSLPAQAQLYPGSQITIMSTTTLQDSLNALVHTKDSVGNAAGASYTTQKQRVIDSVAQALYRTNLLTLKVAKADSGTTLPGYATKTEHNTKVAKADTTTHAGGSYWTPTQATGDQTFTAETVNGLSTFRSAGTRQTLWEDTDADGAQQPYWYWQNANNASKGIFYMGYANKSGATLFGAKDVFIADSISLTLGQVIGTGTQAFYALSFNGFTLRQGASFSDTAKVPLYGSGVIGAGDSVRVAVTGLTIASGYANVSYKRSAAEFGAADTAAAWDINANGQLTLRGKFGYTVGYSVIAK